MHVIWDNWKTNELHIENKQTAVKKTITDLKQKNSINIKYDYLDTILQITLYYLH